MATAFLQMAIKAAQAAEAARKRTASVSGGAGGNPEWNAFQASQPAASGAEFPGPPQEVGDPMGTVGAPQAQQDPMAWFKQAMARSAASRSGPSARSAAGAAQFLQVLDALN